MPADRVAWNWLIPKARRRNDGSVGLWSDQAVDWPRTIGAAGEDFAIPALATMLQGAGVIDDSNT